MKQPNPIAKNSGRPRRNIIKTLKGEQISKRQQRLQKEQVTTGKRPMRRTRLRNKREHPRLRVNVNVSSAQHANGNYLSPNLNNISPSLLSPESIESPETPNSTPQSIIGVGQIEHEAHEFFDQHNSTSTPSPSSLYPSGTQQSNEYIGQPTTPELNNCPPQSVENVNRTRTRVEQSTQQIQSIQQIRSIQQIQQIQQAQNPVATRRQSATQQAAVSANNTQNARNNAMTECELEQEKRQFILRHTIKPQLMELHGQTPSFSTRKLKCRLVPPTDKGFEIGDSLRLYVENRNPCNIRFCLLFRPYSESTESPNWFSPEDLPLASDIIMDEPHERRHRRHKMAMRTSDYMAIFPNMTQQIRIMDRDFHSLQHGEEIVLTIPTAKLPRIRAAKLGSSVQFMLLATTLNHVKDLRHIVHGRSRTRHKVAHCSFSVTLREDGDFGYRMRSGLPLATSNGAANPNLNHQQDLMEDDDEGSLPTQE